MKLGVAFGALVCSWSLFAAVRFSRFSSPGGDNHEWSVWSVVSECGLHFLVLAVLAGALVAIQAKQTLSNGALGSENENKVETETRSVRRLSFAHGSEADCRRYEERYGKNAEYSEALRRDGYSAKRVKEIMGASEEFDAVVIGSGLGGLTCAALLSRQGKKCLVLEQHDVAGGCTHTFEDRGYEFDTGVHYVGGSVCFEGENKTGGRILFDTMTERSGGMRWTKMDEVYDATRIEGQMFEMPEGKKNLKKYLLQQFPREAKGIEKYFDMVAEEQKCAPLFYAWKILYGYLPAFVSDWLQPFMTRAHIAISDMTVKEALEDITDDPMLRSALTYHYGNYGLSPDKASFAIHCMVANHYFEGGAYPEGGSAEIARRIIPTIRASGGGVLVRARVQSIVIDGETDPAHPQVAGVLMDRDGHAIRAKQVICACGVKAAFTKLLPLRFRHLVAGPIRALNDSSVWRSPRGQTSTAHLMLFVALKGSRAELGLPATNLWINPTKDFDARSRNYLRQSSDEVKQASRIDDESNAELVDFPSIFLSFPSTKDGDWGRRFPGKSTAHLVAEAPMEWFKEWESGRVHHRGPDYESLKQMFTKKLLEHMFKEYPHLREKVVFAELGTPLTSKFYLAAEGGESYGLGHSPERFRFPWLRPSTPIKGLMLTGSDVLSAGVFGALTSGFLSAIAADLGVLWNNLGALLRM